MAANITEAYLLYVPIEKDYAHTLYFANAAAQEAYFKGRQKFHETSLSYLRKDGVLRWPGNMETLISSGCNYVMYKNAAYSNRWFYAFITEMSFENPQHTNIKIATDCLQTWMFDVTIKPSFVEREHAANDLPGTHTLDEGLEVGEYICQEIIEDEELKELRYVLLTTKAIFIAEEGDEPPPYPTAINMGGIFYAGGAIVCPNMDMVTEVLEVWDTLGIGDACYAVYMIPKKLVGEDTGLFEGLSDPVKYEITFAKPTTISGTKPRNNKLLSFPYQYLVMSNNAGTSNVLHYEKFQHPEDLCFFEVAGCPVIGGSIKCTPKNYNGISINHDEGIMGGKYPTLSWSQDLFTNWLTQNSVNIALGAFTGVAQIIGGAAAGAAGPIGAAMGYGSIIGGLSTITNTLAQVHQQSYTPPTARGNTNGGDIATAAGRNTFYFYRMSIKPEVAEVIDGYFDMFGYKCHQVKIPEKAHRKAYWYTKTVDAVIDGPIPQEDLQTIKDAYNKGITFWRHTAAVKNYNQDNATV